jgi:hypothetical protein
MSKFSNGATVRVIDNGYSYSTYEAFIEIYAKEKKDRWRKHWDPSEGVVGNVVAQGKHKNADDYLYVIENDDGVFIMGEDGLELVPEPPQSTPLEQAKERYALADRMCKMGACPPNSKRKNTCPFVGIDKGGFGCLIYAVANPDMQKIMEDYLDGEEHTDER